MPDFAFDTATNYRLAIATIECYKNINNIDQRMIRRPINV